MHFRMESKHVVSVPTRLTHINLKTDADIREHVGKREVPATQVRGLSRVGPSHSVPATINALYVCHLHQSKPQESNFTEKEIGILQDRDDNVPYRK
jgi:hypothetical protein